MTPYAHHLDDSYLHAHLAEVAADVRASRRRRRPRHTLRGAVARAMVRTGARLLPDTPELVDGRILVLESPVTEPDLPRAA